jgi:adenylylsulfate kinase
MIVLMTGLPGSGKSHLARALAPLLNADVLDRDEVRNALFPPRDLDYSAAQNELASQILYQVADYILRRDPERTLILDGRPFSRRSQVAEVAALAQRVGHPLRVIHCWVADEVARQRLIQDLGRVRDPASGRDMDKYRRIQSEFEPLTIDHLSLNTDRPVADLCQEALAYLTQPHSGR